MFHYPCNGCTERYIGCHSQCEKYQTARAEHTGKMNQEKAIRYAELDAVIYQRNGYEKRKKKARLSV